MTDAPEGLSTEMRGRQRKYLTMMGIRILCLPLAIVFDGWLRWVFIVAAVVLPYVAVLLANATRRDPGHGPEPVRLPHMYELPPSDSQKDRIGSD